MYLCVSVCTQSTWNFVFVWTRLLFTHLKLSLNWRKIKLQEVSIRASAFSTSSLSLTLLVLFSSPSLPSSLSSFSLFYFYYIFQLKNKCVFPFNGLMVQSSILFPFSSFINTFPLEICHSCQCSTIDIIAVDMLSLIKEMVMHSCERYVMESQRTQLIRS